MISIRQAFLQELRLNSGRFGFSMALCVLSVGAAVTITDGLMTLLPLWAALAWFRYGRADTIDRAELRASLGLSRADRVRGRAAVIGVESIILLLISEIWLLTAPVLDFGTTVRPGATFGISGPPDLSELVLVLVGTLQAVFVLLLTAIVVGGDCVTHRPARSMGVLSIVVYLGAGLLGSVLIGLPLTMLDHVGNPELPYLVAGAGTVVVIAVLALVLRSRIRAWIGLLDSVSATQSLVAA